MTHASNTQPDMTAPGGPAGASDTSRTPDDDRDPLVIDTSVAHPSRVYDFLLVRHEAPFDRAG